MVQRVKFTPAVVAEIEPAGVGTEEYADTEERNLLLRVGANTKTWVFYGRPRPGAKPTRRKLGDANKMSPAQARRACRAMAADLLKGNDPVEKRRVEQGTPTLDRLHEKWMELYAEKHKNTAKRDRWLFGKYFGPLAKHRIDLITPPMVNEWYETLAAESGPYTGNRCLSLLRAMYRRGPSLLNIGVDLKDPASGIERHAEHSRERFVEGDELGRLFAAAAREPVWFQDLLALAVLTGARRRNLFEARWEQFDMARAVWSIPKESSKSKKPLRLHLVGPAVDILVRRHEAAEGAWVFPSPHDARRPLGDVRDRWDRTRRRAKLTDVRWHDLRRSFGAALTRANVPLVAIGAAMGHSPGSHATAVYARLADATVAQAVEHGTAAIVRALPSPVDAVAAGITGRGHAESTSKRTGASVTARTSTSRPRKAR